MDPTTIRVIVMGVGALFGIGAVIFNLVVAKKQATAARSCTKLLHEVRRSRRDLQSDLDNARQEHQRLRAFRERKADRRRQCCKNSDSDSDDDDDTFVSAESNLSDQQKLSELENDGQDGLTNLKLRFDNVDTQIERMAEDRKMALDKLRDWAAKAPEKIDVIWRLGRACVKCSNDTTNESKKKELLLEGIRACDPYIHEENGDLHKWYAVLIGSYGEHLPTIKEQIDSGCRFKEHIDKAIILKPKDSELYLFRGRFKFVMSGLTWFQKTMAKTFIGDIATSTYEDTMADLRLAKDFASRPNKEVSLYIGKCFFQLGKYRDTFNTLYLASQFPIISEDDRRVQSEMDKLFVQVAQKL